MRKSEPGTRSVECPLCHAKPGEECINYGQPGKPRFIGLSHRERFAVYLAQQEAQRGV